MRQYTILNYYFYCYLCYYLYKNTTHDICQHVFMYDEDNNSQTNCSIKYISNTYGGVLQNKSAPTR